MHVAALMHHHRQPAAPGRRALGPAPPLQRKGVRTARGAGAAGPPGSRLARPDHASSPALLPPTQHASPERPGGRHLRQSRGDQRRPGPQVLRLRQVGGAANSIKWRLRLRQGGAVATAAARPSSTMPPSGGRGQSAGWCARQPRPAPRLRHRSLRTRARTATLPALPISPPAGGAHRGQGRCWP